MAVTWTYVIAVAAMVLVGIRPKKIPEWVWPAGGAALLVMLAIEPLQTAAAAVAAQWNVLLFIAGLMGITAAAERSGLIEWIADVILERARGSRRRLFVWTFLVGAALTVLFSNDATAIAFTPVVFRVVSKRGIDPLPYLFACTFVADSASFGLPFSNPANLLIVQRPQFAHFVLHLGPPMLAAVAINLGVFLLIFGKRVRGHYDAVSAPPLEPRARRTLFAMIALVAGYFVALAADWPLGPVAFAGALLAVGAAGMRPRDAIGRIGWSTLVLIGGFFVLLDALEHAGLMALAFRALAAAAHDGPFATILAAAFGSAIASNVLNNLPIAAISGAVVAHGSDASLAYPLVAGVDLGPNLTLVGSLATILWLSIVRARGLDVSAIEYAKLGLSVVPAILLMTSLWLWVLR